MASLIPTGRIIGRKVQAELDLIASSPAVPRAFDGKKSPTSRSLLSQALAGDLGVRRDKGMNDAVSDKLADLPIGPAHSPTRENQEPFCSVHRTRRSLDDSGNFSEFLQAKLSYCSCEESIPNLCVTIRCSDCTLSLFHD